MTPLETDRPRRAGAAILFLLAILIAAGVAALYYLRPRFESQPPQVQLVPDTGMVGLAPLEIMVSDEGMGLKSVTVTLTAGGTEHALASEQLRDPVNERKYTVAFAKIPGLKEGPAVLRVVARDASWWNSFRGNETVLEKPITIDVTPPTIELLADDRYINFGGVGALVYKVSADTATTGVKIGDDFFPGIPGVVQGDPSRFFVLFAHPYNAPADAKATLVATDKAGNTREMRLAYELKNVRYKKSTIALSENFVHGKVEPLVTDVGLRQGPVKELFVDVNERLRKANDAKIAEVTRRVTPSIYWKGAFVQLSNSKVEANFADYRTYTYKGEPISSAYHLGYDLSVTRNYPVEAANDGVVAFTGDLGIYGNAVIIDHGLGLYTLYGHLSAIDVKPGLSVTKRQIIGKTGETGLAAGDHLHFGVYLDGIAILPVEWWDQKWIADNVTPKLEGHGSREIAESQQSTRRTSHRRRR